jgi:hypothetical protein
MASDLNANAAEISCAKLKIMMLSAKNVGRKSSKKVQMADGSRQITQILSA